MITYDFRDDGQIGINPGYTLMAAVQNRWQAPVHLPTRNFSGCGIRPWGLLCTRDRRRRQFSGLHLLVHCFLSTMSCSNSWMNQVTVYKNHWPFTVQWFFYSKHIKIQSGWLYIYCTERKLTVWCTCQIFGRRQSLFIVFIWQCDTHAGVIGCYERFKLISFLFKIGTKTDSQVHVIGSSEYWSNLDHQNHYPCQIFRDRVTEVRILYLITRTRCLRIYQMRLHLTPIFQWPYNHTEHAFPKKIEGIEKHTLFER